MRAMFGEQWIHNEPDTLFIGEKANHPAAPVHMKNLAPYVDIPIRLAIRDNKDIEPFIEKVVSKAGILPDDGTDYSMVMKVLGKLSDDEKKVLFSKGTIYKTLESPQVVVSLNCASVHVKNLMKANFHSQKDNCSRKGSRKLQV